MGAVGATIWAWATCIHPDPLCALVLGVGPLLLRSRVFLFLSNFVSSRVGVLLGLCTSAPVPVLSLVFVTCWAVNRILGSKSLLIRSPKALAQKSNVCDADASTVPSLVGSLSFLSPSCRVFLCCMFQNFPKCVWRGRSVLTQLGMRWALSLIVFLQLGEVFFY